MKRFVFNPQHDLALADGGVSFIPPASVVEFAGRCRWIERFMMAPECMGSVVPWGWNRNLREKLLKEGYPQEVMPTDAQLDFIREVSRRELAVEMLGFIVDEFKVFESKVGVGNIISSNYRIVALSMELVEEFLHSRGRVVLKAPLSGSGKGVRFCAGELMETDRGWCRRVLQRQGAVIVEERKVVVQEFAMLFECCGETPGSELPVRFVGYSLFYASNGAYKGNVLASNEYIEGELGQLVDIDVLYKVRELVQMFLEQKIAGNYTGFVGVDCFVFEEQGKYYLNPAVEINLRMTMGLIARNIYDYFREELGLGDGTHCFEPEKGILPCEVADVLK